MLITENKDWNITKHGSTLTTVDKDRDITKNDSKQIITPRKTQLDEACLS